MLANDFGICIIEKKNIIRVRMEVFCLFLFPIHYHRSYSLIWVKKFYSNFKILLIFWQMNLFDIWKNYFFYRVHKGFRLNLGKCSNMVIYLATLRWVIFFGETRAVEKIRLSLKSNCLTKLSLSKFLIHIIWTIQCST